MRLAKLFRYFRAGPKKFEFGDVEYPKLPDDRVIFAIGDIHGRSDLLEKITSKFDQFYIDHPHADASEIYLGDLIDRGPSSKDVLDKLIERSKNRDLIILRGNHEAALVDVVDDKLRPAIWFSEGGAETLRSYGFDISNHQDDEAIKRAILSISPHHVDFLRKLEVFYEEAGYIFVHAGIRPRVPLFRQVQRDMMWIKDDFLSFRGSFEGVVIHGHSSVDAPEFYKSRIAIDTGAWMSGRLTCLKISSSGIDILST